MSEYNLNTTPVRTSKNYDINDIKLDLEIPQYKKFDNISVYTDDLEKVEINIKESYKNSSELKTKIGLNFKQYEKISITVPENYNVKEPIILDYLFDEDNNYLVDEVEINMEKNSKATFILHYCEEEKNKYFHQLKQITKMKENSHANITIANMINNNSDSFISIENNESENAYLKYNLIELGGKNKISNYYTKLLGDNYEYRK